MVRAIVTFLSLFYISGASSQNGVRFVEKSLDEALSEAKRSNKNIFIDTYADWCIPCKRMELQFLDKELSDVLNQHYINVRINMDLSMYASAYRDRFDIVFLPTMIILDQEGNVKYIIDKEVKAKDLANTARLCLNPNIFFESESTKIVDSPISTNQAKQKRTSNKPEERILHRLDNEKDDANPDYLYKESYFRLQLMDGSYKEIAEKYLKTQKDWSSEKNMRFIMDFLFKTDSEMFEYLVVHRKVFEDRFGKERVQTNLQIIIYNQLYNGVPRPDFERSKELFSHIDAINGQKMAFEYYLNRLDSECHHDEYVTLAQEYIEKFDPKNIYVNYNLCNLQEFGEYNINPQWCINLLEGSKHNKILFPEYYRLLSEICFRNGNSDKGKIYLEKAIELAKRKGLNLSPYLQLKQKYF